MYFFNFKLLIYNFEFTMLLVVNFWYLLSKHKKLLKVTIKVLAFLVKS